MILIFFSRRLIFKINVFKLSDFSRIFYRLKDKSRDNIPHTMERGRDTAEGFNTEIVCIKLCKWSLDIPCFCQHKMFV